MSTMLQQLNQELAEVTARARRSLAQVRSGRRGVGAGVIWHPEGLVITNAHVARSDSPRVVLPDGRVLPARVLARDPDLDVAALSVAASGLPAIELGESTTLQPGQWVIALGHPWGVNGAAAGGVVIGSGLDLPEMPRSGKEWIAVSLPLRPGHSGGPLVDVKGRLVGINTMMAGPEVGLAAPVHVIKAFLKSKLGTGKPEYRSGIPL